MIQKTEEKERLVRDEKLDKLVQLSKEIILKFITDKYKWEFSPKYIMECIDDTKFFIDNNMLSGVGGTYHAHSNSEFNMPITFNRDILKGELLETLGTIIHEITHKFSGEISRGEKLGNPIEEGFADLFSEECINYFLMVEPETLKTFANKEKIDYEESTNRQYRATSDYTGERIFLRTILESIRQTTGKHYDAEFQYILGDKNKFLEIVREAVGDDGVELVLEQKRDKAKLAEKYDKTYIDRLNKIILEKIKLKSVEEIREDGTYNIYQDNNFEDVFKKQKVREALKNCTGIEEINSLSPDIQRGLAEEIGYLMELPQFELQDVLQIIGSYVLDFAKLELTDEKLTRLTLGISKMKLEELDEKQIKAIAYVSLKHNEPNEQLFTVLKEIDGMQPFSQDTQMYVNIAKIKHDEKPKGMKWAQLIKTWSSSNRK